MADIVLKDKNGNPVSYGDVRYIDVPDSSGEVNNFMRTSNIGCYYGFLKEVSDGVFAFTVKGQWFSANRSRSVYGMVNDSMCKEFGELIDGVYHVNILFTHKELKAGETYYADEL